MIDLVDGQVGLRGDTIHETELQRLMPHQYRHGTEPRHRLSLAIILERLLQHTLHGDSVPPPAKGERLRLLVFIFIIDLILINPIKLRINGRSNSLIR